MDIHTYYKNLENALRNVLSTINETEQKNIDEYNLNVNYYDMLNTLYEAERSIKQMLIVHKLRGFSKEEYITIENKKATDLLIEHTVKGYENLLSIAELYGTTIEEIMQINNLTSYEIGASSILKVRISKEHLIENARREVPVFGSRVGTDVLGYDIYNEVRENDAKDIKVIDDPIDTLIQGLKNRIVTKVGDYPFEKDFGLDVVGTDIPKDLAEGLMSLEITEQLKQEPRVETVKNVLVTKKIDSYSYEITVQAIKGKEVISIDI
ncbi:MAG: hypothetical protein A2V66_10755 [Ignavibacteria bacterium RBG_13_36_8]|nr:MAG: hypothetical protein A2V66_10755 [Ignavibacteria bacterium RBG_13_36_8]